MSLPFINKYKSSGLGIDRLCVIAGAEKIYGKNVLVIDAGTCITFDYLNLDNEYCGGSISPGFQIKYKALHNFTANLPLINKLELVDVCSDNTKQCIESGVINGTLAEVEGMIGFYRRNYKDVLVVITGGDGEFIHDNTKEDTVLNENLVFIGLKNIFESNG